MSGYDSLKILISVCVRVVWNKEVSAHKRRADVGQQVSGSRVSLLHVLV